MATYLAPLFAQKDSRLTKNEPTSDGFSKRRYAIADVYDKTNKRTSVFVYVKSSKVAKPPIPEQDMPKEWDEWTHQFISRDLKFPHEPTSNQSFTDVQWEAYRRLGKSLAGDLLGFADANALIFEMRNQNLNAKRSDIIEYFEPKNKENRFLNFLLKQKMQNKFLSTDTFHLTYENLPEPDKSRSGDYCAYKFIESENILILTLADGVGSNVCDWKASEVACKTFIEHFIEYGDAPEMVERIQKAVKAANTEILSEDGHFKGMKTTFLAVVWNFRCGKVFYTSIGDSRIYAIENDSLTQLTKDETTSIIRKSMDGKPLVFAGVTVTGEAVTNVLGALVSCEVHEIEDANLDGLLLASDGFYNCQPSLPYDIIEIMNSEDMETPFQKIIKTYKQYQKDDMTAIIVRKKSQKCEENEHLLNELFEGVSKTSKYDKIILLSNRLSACIEQKNAETCRKIIDFCEKEQIMFNQENINRKIKEMINSGFQDGLTYRGLVNMLRRSNK